MSSRDEFFNKQMRMRSDKEKAKVANLVRKIVREEVKAKAAKKNGGRYTLKHRKGGRHTRRR